MKAIPLHKKLLKGFIKVANWERMYFKEKDRKNNVTLSTSANPQKRVYFENSTITK